MMKKMISLMGALGALFGSAYAATTTVWTEEGDGDKVPAYWYTYTDPTNGSLSSVTESVDGLIKSATLSVTSGKTNSAGFGFGWQQDASYNDVAFSLAAYKGVCLTYSAEAPFRIDFKQSTIKDYNYYGAELKASAGFKKTFIAFSSLTQGWTSKTKVNWSAAYQTGVQFAFKDNHAKSASTTTNNIEISSFILADECVTNPTELVGDAEGTAVLNEGDTLDIDLSTIFSDEDGDATVTASILLNKSYASFVNAKASYEQDGHVYMVATPNVSGDVTVNLKASDGIHAAVSYTLTVTVKDRDNAPVAVDDSYTVKEDSTLKVKITNNFMKNDYDVDDPEGSKPLTIALVDDVQHGTLVLGKNAAGEYDGTFTYTPEANFNGVDFFTYTVTDATSKESDPATVSIEITPVNDPMVLAEVDMSYFKDTLELDEDFNPDTVDALQFPATAFVLEDADGLEQVVYGVTSKGVINAEHLLTGGTHYIMFTPVADAYGLAKLTFWAKSGVDSVGVNFYVKVNPVEDLPVAVKDAYEVKEDVEFSVKAAKGVLANDYSPDDRTVAFIAVLDEVPDHGELTLNEDGSFTYMPEKDFYGEDYFAYHVETAKGQKSGFAIVTLKVIDMPEPPIVVVEPATLDTTIREDSGSLTYAEKLYSTWAKASDGKSKLYYTFTSDDGKTKTQNNKGAWWVLAERDAFGDAYVTVSVTDSVSVPETFKIHIYITPVNDGPVVAMRDTLRVEKTGWSESIVLDSLFYDADGDSLAYKVTAPIVLATEIVDGVLTIAPATDSTVLNDGIFRVKVQAKDAADSTTATIVILVGEAASGIAPVVVTHKATWQNAIVANRGSVALFDMQGRVMWQAKLPVSEAQVRAAAAQVQGRKILQVNRQTWTIK